MAATVKVGTLKDRDSNGADKKVEAKKGTPCLHLTKYKGMPMVVFDHEPEGKFPFQFQAGKAQKILNAIETHGIDAVIDVLKKVAAG